jgi:UDPglucose--hexose-1-phosphate uridylyltransferase
MTSSPEIRIDQLTGQRTVLAPGRANRPDAFDRGGIPEARGDAECPFCEGREDRTPPELWALRPGGGGPDTPGWTARAVPNLYPVLGGEGDFDAEDAEGFASTADPLRASARERQPDLFARRAAGGHHEVIVNAPEHVQSLTKLSEERFAGAVAAWRERMRAHPDAAYLHLILNEGPDAGASLEHTHAQLYALPFVPVAVARERERFAAYHERTAGGHLLSDVGSEEVRRRERLVAIDDEALLVCPWSSRSPFELRVIPRRTSPRFEAEEGTGTAMIRTGLIALERLFGGAPQLNLWVRTAPRSSEDFAWHVDIVPRLTLRAGFEMGTGVDINVYPPERAAADLREALG